jgi:hypothetical protein
MKGSLDNECLLEDDGSVSRACEEYHNKLDTLYDLVQQIGPKREYMQKLAEEMQAIKLAVNEGASRPAAGGRNSPQLQAALAEAKATEEEFGRNSPEARVAWDNVEEVAAAGLDNAMGPRLDEECLVETAMEACRAIEELKRSFDDWSSGKEW